MATVYANDFKTADGKLRAIKTGSKTAGIVLARKLARRKAGRIVEVYSGLTLVARVYAPNVLPVPTLSADDRANLRAEAKQRGIYPERGKKRNKYVTVK
jgi:hypothetical protein